MTEPLRITHIITGLGTGGAETMLVKLLGALPRDQYSPQVISLTGDGPMGDRLRALGIPLRVLEMTPGRLDVMGLLHLARWLRQDAPDLVQTWMYHADLIGGLAAWLAGGLPVIWGVRHTDLDPKRNKRSTLWTVRACAALSSWLPRRIAVNSRAACDAHVRIGYRAEKMRVIPNGFDLSKFQPNLAARGRVRSQLGLPDETPLVGLVARFDPQKDHRTFLRAAALLTGRRPDVHYLLCGEGVTWDNAELASWVEGDALRSSLHLLGRREDIADLMPALDILVSSSAGEAFSNVIGEAMACGVPCAVTDVGDSAFIVGESGQIVPPGDALALANACQILLDLPPERREQLGQAARQRVQTDFGLPVVCARFEALYREVLA